MTKSIAIGTKIATLDTRKRVDGTSFTLRVVGRVTKIAGGVADYEVVSFEVVSGDMRAADHEPVGGGVSLNPAVLGLMTRAGRLEILG